LEWITTKLGGVTQAKIEAKFRIGHTKANQVIMDLIESEFIEECEVMVKNNKGERSVTGYKVVSDDEADLLL
jgi:pyridoxal biosynthesis lyase PdxS